MGKSTAPARGRGPPGALKTGGHRPRPGAGSNRIGSGAPWARNEARGGKRSVTGKRIGPEGGLGGAPNPGGPRGMFRPAANGAPAAGGARGKGPGAFSRRNSRLPNGTGGGTTFN